MINLIIKKAAEAALKATLDQDHPHAETGTSVAYLDQGETDFVPIVRAVLRAVREPSDEMLGAGADKVNDHAEGRGFDSYEGDADDIWKVMIDKLLEE